MAVAAGQYDPEVQVWHCTDDDTPTTLLYVPAAQLAHVVFEVAPCAMEKVPTPQPVQPVETGMPVPVPYVPAAHRVHWPADGRFVAMEYVPAAHGAQVASAVVVQAVAMYWPAAQLVQGVDVLVVHHEPPGHGLGWAALPAQV